MPHIMAEASNVRLGFCINLKNAFSGIGGPLF
jgi:hypothetical protein